MNNNYNEDLIRFNALIREYGGVDSYTTSQAATLFEFICQMVRELGMNPIDRKELLEGTSKIFNLQFINMEDYTHGKYIFVPNHVSEFDGVLFGLLNPKMLVVGKSEWISNPHLNGFLEKLFSIVGVDRKDMSSRINVLRKCIKHLEKSQNSAVTIFVQRTIADIDATTPEDIGSGAYYIAQKTSAKIIPVYCEQISTENPTRIIFGSPLDCDNKNDFGSLWYKSELALRDSITNPSARPPVLCEKHKLPISQREF